MITHLSARAAGLSIVHASGLVCASVVLWLPAAPYASAQGTGANLFVNSDLANGQSPWTLERTKPAEGMFDLLEKSAGPPKDPSRVARLNVTQTAPEPWKAQFYQAGLDLMEGEPYTLVFWARVDRPRTIALNANVTSGDGHGIGLNLQGISLTTDWRKYVYTFTPARVVKNHCRVTFVLGETLGSVYLAGMALRRGKVTHSVGPNLVSNGGFEAGAQGWMFEKKAPGEGSMELASSASGPPGVASKVAHFDIAALGTENWHLQFLQNNVDLEQSEIYTLTFWGRSDRARPLPVVATIGAPDWHRIASDVVETLTPEWKRFSVSFTTAHTLKGQNRIVFILGESLGTVDLAGVSLRREAPGISPDEEASTAGAGVKRNPLVGAWESMGSAPASKLRFTFNADGTGSIRSGTKIDSSGIPRAPVANAFRWYVKLPDSRQIVIGNETYTWSISGIGPEERLTLTDSARKIHALVRRQD